MGRTSCVGRDADHVVVDQLLEYIMSHLAIV